MESFTQPELIKLIALAVAFIVGVIVCAFVVIKESMELKRRREAKRLMYEDAVKQQVRVRQQLRAEADALSQQHNEFRSIV